MASDTHGLPPGVTLANEDPYEAQLDPHMIDYVTMTCSRLGLVKLHHEREAL